MADKRAVKKQKGNKGFYVAFGTEEEFVSFINAAVEETLKDIDQSTHSKAQMVYDCWILTLKEDLGYGKEEILPLLKTYHDTLHEYCHLIVDDSKDDNEVAYAKSSIDRALKEVIGEENFIPFEERFARENSTCKMSSWRFLTKGAIKNG